MSKTFISEGMEFNVNDEFLNIIVNPENQTLEDLCFKYNVESYLHNLEGHAVKSVETGNGLYFLNGKELNHTEWEKEQNNYKFHVKLESIVNE